MSENYGDTEWKAEQYDFGFPRLNNRIAALESENRRLREALERQPHEIQREFSVWYEEYDKLLDGLSPRQVAWSGWLASYNNTKDSGYRAALSEYRQARGE